MVCSNNFTQNLIYVVKRVIFITVLVITSVLKWVLWLPTHQHNLSLVMLEKINHWHHYFLVYIDFWGMVRSKKFAQNLIYVVKRIMFITVLVITSFLRWFLWLPTHKNNLSIVTLKKINHWKNVFVYIEFWGMVRSNNCIKNVIYVVKRLMYITVLVITSVWRWFFCLPTHQRNHCLLMLDKINYSQKKINFT